MGNQLGGMQQATENGVRGMVDQAFAQANAEIEQEVQSYENTVTQRESVLANKRIEINSLRTNINTVNQQCIQIETNNQQQQKQLDVSISKISEKSQQLTEISDQYKQKQLDNKHYVESLTPKDRSFVLQKALNNKSEDIIQLIKNTELDADFRNGDGISLMQTAIEVGHEEIIDKLKSLASEESYHPPEEVMGIANILIQRFCRMAVYSLNMT